MNWQQSIARVLRPDALTEVLLQTWEFLGLVALQRPVICQLLHRLPLEGCRESLKLVLLQGLLG